MNVLKFGCIFALIGIDKFVFAVTDCGYIDDYYEVGLKYECNFICDEENSIEDNLFTEDDEIAVKIVDYTSTMAKSDIRQIVFENCTFFGNSTWRGEWDLIQLTLSHNHLDEIPLNLLAGDIIIRNLDFSNNNIRHIAPLTFENVQSVVRLNLSHNQLTNLHENAFDPLINMKELDLSYNPIKNLKIETFAYLQQLEILSLNHLDISNIQLGIFSHQHKLTSLELSGNGLMSVDFEQNLPIFYELRTLNLSGNQLTDLNGFRNKIFPQLTLLDIRANHFNCSYLRDFFERENVDFTKIRLPDDPQLTKTHRAHIRGVDCKRISISENPHTPQFNNLVGNTQHRDLKDSLRQAQNDLILLKFSMIALCLIAFLIVIVLFCRG